MIKYLNIGIIANYHGLKGYMKVMPLTDDIQRYNHLDKIIIDKNGLNEFVIEDVKYHKNTILLKVKGIDNIDQVRSYKNSYIKIDRENAIELDENSYFICDLIGCSVYDNNEILLGQITEIIQTGSNDVYVVKDNLGKETLIPALQQVIKNVDIKGRRVDVILLEGL